MREYRAGYGTARQDRLRELDRQFLEGADPAQHRELVEIVQRLARQ